MKQDLEKTVLEAAIAAVHRTVGIELKAKAEVKRGNIIIDAEITIGGHKKKVYAA